MTQVNLERDRSAGLFREFVYDRRRRLEARATCILLPSPVTVAPLRDLFYWRLRCWPVEVRGVGITVWSSSVSRSALFAAWQHVQRHPIFQPHSVPWGASWTTRGAIIWLTSRTAGHRVNIWERC